MIDIEKMKALAPQLRNASQEWFLDDPKEHCAVAATAIDTLLSELEASNQKRKEAVMDAERAREERNRSQVKLNAVWIEKTAALRAELEAAKLDVLRLQRSGQMAATCTHNNIVVMQAAWIEWQYGEGAEGAMEWIENSLAGPGLIPEPDEPHGREAQAYFDANRSQKLYDQALDAAIDSALAQRQEGEEK